MESKHGEKIQFNWEPNKAGLTISIKDKTYVYPNRERSMESNAGVRQDAVIAVTMSVIGYAEARVECIRRPQSWQHRKLKAITRAGRRGPCCCQIRAPGYHSG
jgi:hypothetical protein